nr:troponin T, skeletal muscle-like [Coffea arabica]
MEDESESETEEENDRFSGANEYGGEEEMLEICFRMLMTMVKLHSNSREMKPQMSRCNVQNRRMFMEDDEFKGRYKDFILEKFLKDPKFEIGMKFESRVQFNFAVSEYGIRMGKPVWTSKNEPTKPINGGIQWPQSDMLELDPPASVTQPSSLKKVRKRDLQKEKIMAKGCEGGEEVEEEEEAGEGKEEREDLLDLSQVEEEKEEEAREGEEEREDLLDLEQVLEVLLDILIFF